LGGGGAYLVKVQGEGAVLHPRFIARGIRSRSRAFTLVELLVVIAIIGILAGLSLPVLAKAKAKGQQAACLNNLRQMALGFQLYEDDSTDQFPAGGSAHVYGPQPEDWIWWQYGRDVQKSAIAKYVSGFQAALFTCPMDIDARNLQTKGDLPDDPYRYSYSLTSYDLIQSPGTNAPINPGMSTIITKAREVYPFRQADIKNPSAKVMLIEESRATINDSRWVPDNATGGNLITTRHNGKGDIVFADSHIEPETPEFGKNPANSKPTF
jgi:prepilin-type N-terminal cleavage/methylation domain-containing protein/prepilin-type processing-associated H-X9-DG protein